MKNILILISIIYLLSQVSCDTCSVDVENRVDCGYYGINQSGCEGKGCCWVPANPGQVWCFYKSQSQKYSCNSGQCNSDDQGQFSSLSDCQSSCQQPVTKYSCSSGSCNSDDQGSFSTLSDCQASCAQPQQKYSCNSGACNSDDSGSYSSLSDCQAACSVPQQKYSCNSGDCSEDSQGSFGSLIDCKNACFVGQKYSCNSGSCSASEQGTFHSLDDCEKGCALSGCQTFHENQCSGDNIITDPSFEDHRWFTPLKGDPDYQESFQDYGRLVGHVHTVYSSDLKSAIVEVKALHKDSSVTLSYNFDGVSQDSSKKTYSSDYEQVLQIIIKGSDDSQLILEPVDFKWNAPEVSHSSGDYRSGQKGSIVEFFGWPHKDIEKECEFLSKSGYLGAKVFPAQEQVMSQQTFQNALNPWYFMYQPVSYRLQGRMGTRDDLRNLIKTCRKMNVRVYADAVVNHMVGSGNDANPHHRNQAGNNCIYFPNKNSSLDGGMSPMYTQGFDYTKNSRTGKPPSQEFPAVPYGPTDFHCERSLNSWTSPLILNAGWLSGLVDLNTEKDNVQERIADYMTDMLGLGFSGFRIDAAKHMKPEDITGFMTKLKRNMGGKLPEDFILWMEILLGGEADLLMCDKSSTYQYSSYLEGLLKNAGFDQEDIDKIKVWNSGYPKEPGHGYCNMSPKRNAIQNDDADQQNPGSSSRDMQGTGCVLIKECDPEEHRQFEVKLFENPNGASDNANDYPIRLILSSFYRVNDTAVGIPDGKSDCSQCLFNCENCQGVAYKSAYDATSTGYDGKKGQNEYSRVHRDITIINAMRTWMRLSQTSHDILLSSKTSISQNSQVEQEADQFLKKISA